MTALRGAATTRETVVVAVRGTKLHPVGGVEIIVRRRHRIPGVSAVPGHRQPVLTDLISDGKRRVFSRVPQTRSALDLRTRTVQLLGLHDEQ